MKKFLLIAALAWAAAAIWKWAWPFRKNENLGTFFYAPTDGFSPSIGPIPDTWGESVDLGKAESKGITVSLDAFTFKDPEALKKLLSAPQQSLVLEYQNPDGETMRESRRLTSEY